MDKHLAKAVVAFRLLLIFKNLSDLFNTIFTIIIITCALMSTLLRLVNQWGAIIIIHTVINMLEFFACHDMLITLKASGIGDGLDTEH